MYLKSQTKYTGKVEQTIVDNFNCQWFKHVICRACHWPYSVQCEIANKHKRLRSTPEKISYLKCELLANLLIMPKPGYCISVIFQAGAGCISVISWCELQNFMNLSCLHYCS